MYGIGEISKLFGLSISTLRYYDKEGLLLNIKRDPSGIRRFDEGDIDTIRMIEYLKKAGLQLREIKTFMAWCKEGDATLEQRQNMFLERRAAVDRQLRELEQTRDLIDFKCWYYGTAVREGTERRVRTLSPEQMPPDVRRAFESSHSGTLCACAALLPKEG